MHLHTIASPAAWALFVLLVLALLGADLGLFHRKPHAVSPKEACCWSAFWIALGLMFGFGVYRVCGAQKGLEFLAGYSIEKALALDNLFVIVAIFRYFEIPAEHQHRVLFWGILGAIVLRALFILVGSALLSAFAWALYVFGGLLLITAVRMLLGGNGEAPLGERVLVRWLKRVLPLRDGVRGPEFFQIERGRLYVTPLLVCALVIEFSDILFALDSIPAIFAVTRDPFIVFSSNILAILGLRSLFFLFARFVTRLRFLRFGLAAVLLLVAVKLLLRSVIDISVWLSLVLTLGLVLLSVLASFIAEQLAPKRLSH